MTNMIARPEKLRGSTTKPTESDGQSKTRGRGGCPAGVGRGGSRLTAVSPSDLTIHSRNRRSEKVEDQAFLSCDMILMPIGSSRQETEVMEAGLSLVVTRCYAQLRGRMTSACRAQSL